MDIPPAFPGALGQRTAVRERGVGECDDGRGGVDCRKKRPQPIKRGFTLWCYQEGGSYSPQAQHCRTFSLWRRCLLRPEVAASVFFGVSRVR